MSFSSALCFAKLPQKFGCLLCIHKLPGHVECEEPRARTKGFSTNEPTGLCYHTEIQEHLTQADLKYLKQASAPVAHFSGRE